MACFVAPAAVAIVTTVAQKVLEKKDKDLKSNTSGEVALSVRGKWARRLSWLNIMLWGGTIMLVFDHAWAGEVVPWPPFFTALETPGAVGPMLGEIVTLGLAMTAGVVVVWGIMVAIAELTERRAAARTHTSA